MSIKYALLGLVGDEPMHGYRLKEAFDHRIGTLWGLTRGQIYETLNALERRGFVTSHGERVGSRPARRIYALTDSGRRALERWLDAALIAPPRPFRADVLLRLLFVRGRDVAAIDGALERAAARLLEVKDRIARTRSGPQRGGTIDVAAILRIAAARHADADLELLRRCRAALTDQSGVDDGGVRPDVSPPATAARRHPTMRASVSRLDGRVTDHDRGVRTAVEPEAIRANPRRGAVR